MPEQLPELANLSEREKDALLVELWGENQALRHMVKLLEERLAVLEAKLKEPPKTPKNSSLPPSQGRKGNRPGKLKGMRRQASVGRAGGGRELVAQPDQEITALAKVCSHCGEGSRCASKNWRRSMTKSSPRRSARW